MLVPVPIEPVSICRIPLGDLPPHPVLELLVGHDLLELGNSATTRSAPAAAIWLGHRRDANAVGANLFGFAVGQVAGEAGRGVVAASRQPDDTAEGVTANATLP
jgi:hypothetical protein